MCVWISSPFSTDCTYFWLRRLRYIGRCILLGSHYDDWAALVSSSRWSVRCTTAGTPVYTVTALTQTMTLHLGQNLRETHLLVQKLVGMYVSLSRSSAYWNVVLRESTHNLLYLTPFTLYMESMIYWYSRCCQLLTYSCSHIRICRLWFSSPVVNRHSRVDVSSRQTLNWAEVEGSGQQGSSIVVLFMSLHKSAMLFLMSYYMSTVVSDIKENEIHRCIIFHIDSILRFYRWEIIHHKDQTKIDHYNSVNSLAMLSICDMMSNDISSLLSRAFNLCSIQCLPRALIFLVAITFLRITNGKYWNE